MTVMYGEPLSKYDTKEKQTLVGGNFGFVFCNLPTFDLMPPVSQLDLDYL